MLRCLFLIVLHLELVMPAWTPCHPSWFFHAEKIIFWVCRQSYDMYERVSTFQGAGELKHEALVNSGNALCEWASITTSLPEEQGGGIVAAEFYNQAEERCSTWYILRVILHFNRLFDWELIVLHTAPSMFVKFSVMLSGSLEVSTKYILYQVYEGRTHFSMPRSARTSLILHELE